MTPEVFAHSRERINPRIAADRPTAHPADEQIEWLTAAEAARYLKIRERTLLLWARQGKVKGYALSGKKRHVWRFRRSDLDAMLIRPSVPCSKGAQ